MVVQKKDLNYSSVTKKSRDILYPLVAWSMSIVKVAGTWLVGQSIKPKVKVTKT